MWFIFFKCVSFSILQRATMFNSVSIFLSFNEVWVSLLLLPGLQFLKNKTLHWSTRVLKMNFKSFFRIHALVTDMNVSDPHLSLEPNDRSCIPVRPKRFGLVSLLPSRLVPVERGIPEDNLRGRPTVCTPSPVLPSLLAVEYVA
jgi:hypothetical protein